jgi:glycosyltransferase involved in cell wall biosynthesis
LHLIDSDGVYGAERVVLNLSAEHRDSGAVRPIVGSIVPNSGAKNALFDAAIVAGIEALKIPISNLMLWIDLPRAAYCLRKQGIGLIHAHGYKASVYGFLIKLMTGIPVISTCHLWFEPEKGPLKMRAMVAIEKRLYRWFPKVLTVSEDIRQTLLAHGVVAGKVDVIVNGVDPTHISLSTADRSALRRSLALTDSDFCVLNAARLDRQKAQWILIEAAALLKAAGKPCRFLIIGAGGLEEQLRALIIAKDVSDCVRLLGFRDDIGQLMDICDVFALPSLDEGMPMSLLEAAAAKIPIVATAVGDIPKLITENHSGLIVPVGNPHALAAALERIRERPSMALELAETAYRQLVARYSCAAMGQSYLNVYRDVLNLPTNNSSVAG